GSRSMRIGVRWEHRAAAVAGMLVSAISAAWANPWLAGPLERPDDPPGKPVRARALAPIDWPVTFGRFTHVQVNVSGDGMDIGGDAANEPSIAVDPANHDHIVIGWRQFV